MHIVAIDTIVFITIGAGAVATPKMLPIYVQFIFETDTLKILGLKPQPCTTKSNRQKKKNGRKTRPPTKTANVYGYSLQCNLDTPAETDISDAVI
jgi:hypothetical protein